MINRSDIIATERLRSTGLRVTNPRVSIYAFLLDNTSHPTCEEIYRILKSEDEGLSFASVYNVTQKLAEVGLVKELIAPDGQKHYDAITSFHGHFFCNHCNSIYDFACTKQMYEKQLSTHRLESINIYAKGTCEKCL
ncbi:MAG: transcriptional repressor [Saccharofermentans sp.]|nr:transcriptional repressor [Saccharofermentans sp.]